VARGARDWSAAAAVVDELLHAKPGDPAATSVYAAGDQQLELPSTLVPPTATLTVADTSPRAGRAFDLDVRVTWAGTFDDYLLLPPEAHLPEGVTVLSTSATSSSRDGAAVVTYHLRLLANAAGAFALDPVELRYTPRGEGEPSPRASPGPPSSSLPHPARPAPLGLGSGPRGRPRARCSDSRRAQLAPPTQRRAASAGRGRRRAPQRAARRGATQTRGGGRRRLRRRAHPLEVELGATETDPAAARLLEQIRYGGATPSEEELNQWLRRLERRLNEQSADPGAIERARIRMAQTKV